MGNWSCVDDHLTNLQLCQGIVGWDELDLLASIAQRQQARPLPLAQMSIEVFDKESYDRIIDLVKELGPQHIILQTKL